MRKIALATENAPNAIDVKVVALICDSSPAPQNIGSAVHCAVRPAAARLPQQSSCDARTPNG
jgi:hypothetical protein